MTLKNPLLSERKDKCREQKDICQAGRGGETFWEFHSYNINYLADKTAQRGLESFTTLTSFWKFPFRWLGGSPAEQPLQYFV